VRAPWLWQETLVDPFLGSQRLEGEDRAPISAALGVPDRRIRRVWMVGDERIESVEIALSGMDRLRAADLLGRLAEEDQRAGQIRLLHSSLGGQNSRQRADAEHRVRVGVARRPGVQALAWLLIGNECLGITRHGVVLSVGSEDWSTFAIA